MRSWVVCGGVFCALLAAGITTAEAQRNVAATQAPSVARASVLDHAITVTIERLPLADAMKLVSERANVMIQYRHEMLDRVPGTVSLKANDMPLGAALGSLLMGSGLHAVATASDVVTIVAVSGKEQAKDGVVVGTVLHASTKQPVVGASVRVGDGQKTVTTDNDGRFRLVLSAGEHELQIRSVGFVRQVRRVTVEEGATLSLEMLLEPSANVLNEVIVTGTVVATERKAIATPITVITAAEIQNRGVTRIEEFLRGEVPGVLVLDDGINAYNAGDSGNPVLGRMTTTQVYSRGSSGLGNAASQATPLKTYVDGIELFDPSYLGTIDPNTIDRIEIVTGPQAATIYGSGAMGGVMQIFTKKGAGRSALDITVSLRTGILQNNASNGLTPSHNHAITLAGGIGPEFSYTASTSYTYTGQWSPKLFSRRRGGSVGMTYGQGALVANGSVGVTTTQNGSTLGSGQSSSSLYWANVHSGKWNRYLAASTLSGRVTSSSSQTMALTLDYRLRDNWQHQFTMGRSQTVLGLKAEAPEFGRPADSLYGAGSSGGTRNTWGYTTSLLMSQRGLSSSLTLGLSGTNGEETRFRGCLPTESSTSYVACSTSATSFGVTRTLGLASWGGFSSWRIGVFERLYFTFGLRAESNPDYGSDHHIDWTPTQGIAYTHDIGGLTFKLLASYGRATRPPAPRMREDGLSPITVGVEPSQYLQWRGNPNLTPEYSRGPQGGLELYYGNTLTLTVNRYDQKISDLIQAMVVDSVTRTWPAYDYSEAGFVYQHQNVAVIRQHGWETTGALSLGRLSFKGTYSLMSSRIISVRSDGLVCGAHATGCRYDLYPGMSFSMPDHTAAVTVGYGFGGTSFSVISNYIGQQTIGGGDPFAHSNNFQRLREYVDRRSVASGAWRKPGYWKSNLVASQRINASLLLTLNVSNLSNRFVADGLMWNPSLGRQTLMGVTWRPVIK